jgi:hypothetical protein
MHFTCRHDQQSVVDLAIGARELYSNRTVANFLPVSRSCTISQAFCGQDQTILYAANPIGDSEALRAEGFDVLPIQRLFRGHVIPLGQLRLLTFWLNISPLSAALAMNPYCGRRCRRTA